MHTLYVLWIKLILDWNKTAISFFYRSMSNGNCLFSTMSIHLVGDSSLCHILRVLSSFELFLFSDFYFSHPNFHYVHKLFPESFKHYNNAFSFAVSVNLPDGVPYSSELITLEALHTCVDKQWASYVSILALSSVLKCRIWVHRPRSGEAAYQILYNSVILPRCFYTEGDQSFFNFKSFTSKKPCLPTAKKPSTAQSSRTLKKSKHSVPFRPTQFLILMLQKGLIRCTVVL